MDCGLWTVDSSVVLLYYPARATTLNGEGPVKRVGDSADCTSYIPFSRQNGNHVEFEVRSLFLFNLYCTRRTVQVVPQGRGLATGLRRYSML